MKVDSAQTAQVNNVSHVQNRNIKKAEAEKSAAAKTGSMDTVAISDKAKLMAAQAEAQKNEKQS